MKGGHCALVFLLLLAPVLGNQCSQFTRTLTLDKIYFYGYLTHAVLDVENEADCIEKCYQMDGCQAVNYCTVCSETSYPSKFKKCYILKTDYGLWARADSKWRATVMMPNFKKMLMVQETAISGDESFLPCSANIDTAQECMRHCLHDDSCLAFSFSPKQDKKCKLFSGSLSNPVATDDTYSFIMNGLSKEGLKEKEDSNMMARRVMSTKSEAYIGPSCSTDANCPMPNTKCLGKECACTPGYFYSLSKDACVEECPLSEQKRNVLGRTLGLSPGRSPSYRSTHRGYISCIDWCVETSYCMAVKFDETNSYCSMYQQTDLSSGWDESQDRNTHFLMRACK